MSNTPDFSPEYTYEKLNEMYENALKGSRNGTATRQESSLGMAAAYAIDFIDTAKTVKAELNITAQTEEHVTKVMTAVYFSDRRAGKSHHDSKTLLIKKFAYYELFSIVNSLNAEGKVVEIVCDDSAGGAVPRPIIRTVSDIDGEYRSFDVLDAAERTIDKFRFNKPNGDGPLFAGTLAPFYQKVKEELMDYLVKC